MRIKKLPANVANQIAAGEVIERPASIVKELLENSFDAQADNLNIEIGYGGLNLIKISDNGIGIFAEDLPLAIAAHATSKIQQLSDLNGIASMGFRGEALASIASVSKMIVSSKPSLQEHAMMLIAEGEVCRLEPCARSKGTTIEVRDIFFNAPVRKKFLKSSFNEFQAIETVVKRFALSAMHIAITLMHNNKLVWHLPAAHCEKTRILRVAKLLGKPFIEQSYFLNVEHANFKLIGWVSSPDYQRSQSDKVWVYVNQRMVRDKLLNHAIKKAYEDILYPGRYPSCLLYLITPPEEVDVNVHPTKHEVRFQQPRLIHDFICSQIQKILQNSKVKGQIQQTGSASKVQKNIPFMETLNVHEPLQQNNYSYSNPVKPNCTNSTWIILNSAFAIINLREESFLVDTVRLYHQWLLDYLMQQALPLASRPLLLPITHRMKQAEIAVLEVNKENISQIGVEFDLLSNDTVILRTLPIDVPYLDIKSFLNASVTVRIAANCQLVELLVDSQQWDVQQASKEELNNLFEFIQIQGAEKLKNCCKHLSLAVCRDLLNA